MVVVVVKVMLVSSLGKVFKQCSPVGDGKRATKDIFRASPIWRDDSIGDNSKSGLLWRLLAPNFISAGDCIQRTHPHDGQKGNAN